MNCKIAILVLLLTMLITACSQLTTLVVEPETGTVPGIAEFLSRSDLAFLVIVPGMGTHVPGYSRSFTDRLATALGRTRGHRL